MDYKKIVLVGLLLPIFCCAKDNVSRLEELKGLRCELILKIRRLGKMISEADSIRKDFVRHSTEKRLTKENDLMLHELTDALLGKQKFDYSLVHKLFDLKNIKKKYTFNSDTFLAIRATLETEFMMIAVAEYEGYVQKLIEINKEIHDLKKS